MPRRRVISRAPRTVGPSFSLPIIQRACFLVSGQLPALLLRDSVSQQEVQAASGSFSQVSDGQTGGLVLKAGNTSGALLFTSPTGQAQKPATALTCAVRVNLPSAGGAGQYLFGRKNSTLGKASFGVLSATGLVVVSGATNTSGTNGVTGTVTVSGTVSGSIVVAAWRAGSPWGSATVSGTTTSCVANESQLSAGDNLLLTTTPVTGTTTTATALVTGNGSVGDVYGTIAAQVKAGISGMTVTIDSQEPGASGHATGPYAGAPLTWPFNNVAGDLLLVGVTLSEVFGGPGTMTLGPVSYGGVTMTAVSGTPYGGASSNDLTGLYYLLNPPTGSNTVSVQFSTSSGNVDCIGGAISFNSGGGSVLLFEASNAGGTTDTSTLLVASGWHTVVGRYRSATTVDLSIFDDNGIKVGEASGTPASGSIAWDSTSALTLMQAMLGSLDFAVLTPSYESDSSITALVQRRKEIFSAMNTGQVYAPAGGNVFTQALSGAASGATSALGLYRNIAITKSANVTTPELLTQKASVMANLMRVAAALSAPARTLTIPTAAGNVVASITDSIIARTLAARVDITVHAMTRLEARAMTASTNVASIIARGLTAVQETATTTAAALVNRYTRTHSATTTAASADFVRRLIRTADTTGTNVSVRLPLSKLVSFTASAGSAGAMGRRIIASSHLALTGGGAALLRAARHGVTATARPAAALAASLGNSILTAASHGGAVLVRRPGRLLAGAQAAFAGAFSRQPGRVPTAMVQGEPTLVPSQEHERSLNASANAGASLVKRLFRALVAAFSALAAIGTATQYPPQRQITITNEQFKSSGMLGEKLD